MNVKLDPDEWKIVHAESDPCKWGCCKQPGNESQRRAAEDSAAMRIQKLTKRHLTRKIVRSKAERNLAVTRVQSGIRGYFARRSFIKMKMAMLKLQATIKNMIAQEYARKCKWSATMIQTGIRGMWCRRNARAMRKKIDELSLPKYQHLIAWMLKL